MISRIQALRYRCFDQLDVPWQRYNVLAGANGSGKSTLLDIPQLFCEILLSRKGLVPVFLETSSALGAPRAQRLEDLTHCQRGTDFGFVLEATLPEDVVSRLVEDATLSVQKNPRRWPHTLRYEIRFGIFNGLELQVLEEFLWLIPQNATQKEQGIHIGEPRPRSWLPIITRELGRSTEERPILLDFEIKPRQRRDDFPLRLSPDELALSNVPRDASLWPATIWFIEWLTRDTLSYAPDIKELHKACPPGQPKTIKANAANLPWMVLNLKQESPNMFAAWIEHIKTALPTIANIDAIRREDNFAYLKVDYQGGYSITSPGLSGGTLSIFAHTILPYLITPPELVCLEEPENGIHPRAIEAVLQSLTSLYDSQVWLSTHSPIVLAHTDLNALIIMNADGNGGIKAIPGYQHERLSNWRGGIDLGSLFAAGVFE